MSDTERDIETASNDRKQALNSIEIRISQWRTRFKYASSIYYIVGVVGVATSTIAAALPQESFQYSRYCSAASAICFAILGFVQPDRMYTKFVRAWRILDAAHVRYKAGAIGLKELASKLEDGENSLSRFEEGATGRHQQTLPWDKKP